MSEYNSENHCPECDATGGDHYPGCIYEATDSDFLQSRHNQDNDVHYYIHS